MKNNLKELEEKRKAELFHKEEREQKRLIEREKQMQEKIEIAKKFFLFRLRIFFRINSIMKI